MPDQSAPDIQILRTAYAAFNARDIDPALALMPNGRTSPSANLRLISGQSTRSI